MTVSVRHTADVVNEENVDALALQAAQTPLIGAHHGIVRVVKFALVRFRCDESLPRDRKIAPCAGSELAACLGRDYQTPGGIQVAQSQPEALLAQSETVVRSRVEISDPELDGCAS